MNYFDLHCDTATCLYDDGEDFENTDKIVNARDARLFDKYFQTFAFWFDDRTNIRGFDYLKKALGYFLDIKRTFPGKCVLAVEGGAGIDGNLDNLFFLKENGFSFFGLSWNGENALASGNAFSPSEGLSSLGKEAVRILDSLDIVPDISHLSDAGVFDVFSQTKKRVVATHSCCRSVYPSMRNITDEMIKEIIKRKGLIGLNLYPKALSDDPKSEDLLRHAEHILSLGGEDCLALGCDWDGTSLFEEVSGLTFVQELFEMLKNTFSKEIAEKIVYDNAAEFLEVF